MLRAILNKSWRQHPTRHQLYGKLPHITKTIQARRTRHAGHCWRSKDELISDVLLWTPAYNQTYNQAMNDRKKWRERVRDIRAGGTSSWWWWYQNSKEFCASHILGFWVEHLPFVCIVKFKLLELFPVDHLIHPVVSSLTRYLF